MCSFHHAVSAGSMLCFTEMLINCHIFCRFDYDYMYSNRFYYLFDLIMLRYHMTSDEPVLERTTTALDTGTVSLRSFIICHIILVLVAVPLD